MEFELKFKIFIFSIVILVLLILFTIFFIVIDMYMINKEISQLTKDNIRLISQTKKTIDYTTKSLDKIDIYLNDPSLPEKLTQLDKITRYIDINNERELKKVIEITESTPLDIVTASIIIGYCNKLNLSPSLLLALIEQESSFNQYEIGADKDRGYCQIIPQTEKWLAKTYGHILDIQYDSSRIFDPEYNIGLGALYLYILKQAYGDNYHKILSEYNRGVYNLERYYEKHGTYATAYSRGILRREAKYRYIN